jgi:multimeric flavodoxin WrbA
MKTVIISGQNHKGSTYHIARSLADKLGGKVTEFFLPRDFGKFCIGCSQCFMENEEKCPHYADLKPITDAIDDADVIILASPVYVYHASGAMKAFLDHYGWRWMVHRPEEKMFRKQGVCISTAAGAGMKSTNKDMADSLFFWGVARIYKYSKAVGAVCWEDVKPEMKSRIDVDTSALARKISARSLKLTPSLKTRGMFFAMHMMQKNGFNPADVAYWKKKGWTEDKRPWK